MKRHVKKIISRINFDHNQDVNSFVTLVKSESRILEESTLSYRLFSFYIVSKRVMSQKMTLLHQKANKYFWYMMTIGSLTKYMSARYYRKKFIKASSLINIRDNGLFISTLYSEVLGRGVDNEAELFIKKALNEDANFRMHVLFNVQYSDEIQTAQTYIQGIWILKILQMQKSWLDRMMKKIAGGFVK